MNTSEVCWFKTDGLMAAMNNAIDAKEWMTTVGTNDDVPALFFVHDEGSVFIMDNVIGGNVVVYAEGMNPLVDDNAVETIQNALVAIDGDDFAEYLPLSLVYDVLGERPGAAYMGIVVTAGGLDFVLADDFTAV